MSDITLFLIVIIFIVILSYICYICILHEIGKFRPDLVFNKIFNIVLVCIIVLFVYVFGLYFWFSIENNIDNSNNYKVIKWTGEVKIVFIKSIEKENEIYKIIDDKNIEYYVDIIEDEKMKKTKIGLAKIRNTYGFFYNIKDNIYFAKKIE